MVNEEVLEAAVDAAEKSADEAFEAAAERTLEAMLPAELVGEGLERLRRRKGAFLESDLGSDDPVVRTHAKAKRAAQEAYLEIMAPFLTKRLSQSDKEHGIAGRIWPR